MNPVPGSIPSAGYLQRGTSWSLGRDASGRGLHTGRDFAAPAGTPIYAATHGVVIAADAYDSAYGYKVIIVSPDGFEDWYCHMPAGAARVRAGDKIEAGQRIGAVGSTGNVTGPHLHLERRVRGGKFALATFRDPAAAVAFTPRPLRFESVNLGDDNAKGKATRKNRRARLLTDILRPAPCVTFFQEAPKSGIYKWLTANVKNRPRGKRQRQREIAGASGRRIWASKRTAVLATGTFTPAQRGISSGKPGAPKPFTWALVRIDAYRVRLVVNVHGPFGIGYTKKLRYFKQVFAEVERLRKHYGLARWQVITGGDTNAPKAARAAAKPYGWRDARPRARKTRGAKYSTLNGWKPRRRLGGRPDLWLTHKDVTVLEYRNPRDRGTRSGKQALTDHNLQVLIFQ